MTINKKHFAWSILLCLTCMFACIHDPISYNAITNTKEYLSINDAKIFFEQQIQNNPDARAIKSKGLYPGDYTPQWENAQTSQNKYVGSVDVPIIPQYGFKAVRSEMKNGIAKAYIVPIIQKLVIVKGKKSEKLSPYLLTLIPDNVYYSKNKNSLQKKYLNSGETDFNGIAIYFDIQTRYIIRVEKFVDGIRKKGIYLICKSDNWKEKAKIARNILGPVKIIKNSRQVATRSFGEDGGIADLPCWFCGSPSCTGGCGEDVIITPDYCGGCGEYNFACTCGTCPACGGDPCSCSNACPFCGDDPCSCYDSSCPSCGSDPCICYECPNCGSSSCSGDCSNWTEQPYPGEDGDTSKNDPNDTKIKLNKIISDAKIKNFIGSRDIPIKKDENVKGITIRIISRSDGTVIGIEGIFYNEKYFSGLTDQGELLVLFHEYLHGYLAMNGNRWDHSTFINSNEYMQGIKDIFPDQSDEFYEMMRYAGCADADEFKNLSFKEKSEIASFVNNYIKE